MRCGSGNADLCDMLPELFGARADASSQGHRRQDRIHRADIVSGFVVRHPDSL